MLNDGHVPGRKPAIHDGFHRSIHTDLSNGGGSAGSCGKGPGGPSLDRTDPRVKRRAAYGLLLSPLMRAHDLGAWMLAVQTEPN